MTSPIQQSLQYLKSCILNWPNSMESPSKTETSSSALTPRGDDAVTTENQQNREIEYMQIDTRYPEWNFHQVTDIEIVEAMEDQYPDDFTKSVEEIGRYKKSLQGIFRIDSSDYSDYIGASLTIRGKDLPFKPWYRRNNDHGPSYQPRRKEGTLITIYQAYRIDHRNIDNEDFDSAFENLGVEILKPTLPQLRKGTTTLNNNRYLVVQKLDKEEELKKKIGTYIVVNGHKFNVVYDGIQKHCWICMKTHGIQCPKKARDDHLRKQRQGRTGKRKIYTSSVFRHVNSLALTTDTACMPGGGIGQIVNAIKHDEKHDEIIIAGGTNELVHSDDLQQFIFTIEKSVEKLKTLADEIPTSFVMPSLPLDTPELKAKSTYLEEKLKVVTNMKLIKPHDIEYDDIHPTEKGTKHIIHQLNDAFNKEIILEEAEDDDLTTKRYRHVQALYKVGCRACETPNLNNDLCNECKEKAKQVDISLLEAEIQKERDLMYPAPPDVEMDDQTRSSDKRPLSGEESSELPPKVSRNDAST